jgi:hypothetical protein
MCEIVEDILAIKHSTHLIQNTLHEIQNFKLGQLAKNGVFMLTAPLQCTSHITYIKMKHTHLLIRVRR